MRLIGPIFLAALSLHVILASPASASASGSTNDLSAQIQAIEQTSPLPLDELPASANFYSAQHPENPPLPGNILGLPAWSLGNNVYLLDDTNVVDGLSSAPMAMSSMDASGPPVPSDVGGGSGTNSYPAPTYSFDTNGLWLQITNLDTNWCYLNLNNATNQVYAIWSTTNLPGNWVVETEVWPTNSVITSFTVPTLGRPNLFLRAEDWTGVTENGNTTPDWWFWMYFGTTALADTNLDSSGQTLLYDYTNNVDLSAITFSLSLTNNYVTGNFRLQINLQSGAPFYQAVLVDSTNYTGANWSPYTSSNITVNPGSTEGWHDVWIGLLAHSPNANAVWQWKRVYLDATPPVLVVTNPVASTISVPLLQLQGYCTKPLAGLNYAVSNAASLLTNQIGLITGQFYDTNIHAFSTNWFACVDVPLTNGMNLITLNAIDLAGNTSTTNFVFTVDYSTRTNPPAVQLFWPQNGAQICGGTFTWRGWVDDPTATVTAELVDTNGDTNLFPGIVERDGNFWVENFPLESGTNLLALTVTDSAGNVAFTNISVTSGSLGLTVNQPGYDQLWDPILTVYGSINDTNYTVWVNGAMATLNGDGTWTATNVVMPPGGTALIQARAIPNSDNGGNGLGNGGATPSYTNPNNPLPSQPGGSQDTEIQIDRPLRVYVSSDSQHRDYYTAYSFNDYTLNGNEWDWGYGKGENHYDQSWGDGIGGTSLTSGGGYDVALWIDHGPVTNSAGTYEPYTFPATSWPDVPPLLTIYQEHCDVSTYFSSNYSVITYLSPYSTDKGLFTGSNYSSYTRHAQDTMILQTGGKSGTGQNRVFSIGAYAIDQNTGKWIMGPPLSIGGLGSEPDPELGVLYAVLPNNIQVDVTPHTLESDYYTFSVDADDYTLQICANGINLSWATTPPSFCVGQQVTFSNQWFEFSPGGQGSYDWVMSAQFVNEWSQAYNLDGDGNPVYYGSTNYDLNPDLLKTNQPSVWWTSGGLKNIKSTVTLTFDNGQSATLNAKGTVIIHRPTVTMKPFTAAQTNRYFTLSSTNNGLWSLLTYGAPDDSGLGSMDYTVQVLSDFSGLANITQLITCDYSNPLFVFSDERCDGPEFYNNNSKNVYGWGTNQITGLPTPPSREDVGFQDGPAGYWEDPNVVNISARDFIRFQPNGTNNIWVTLGIVNWNAAAVAEQNGIGQWSITSHATPAPTGPDNSNEMPFWTKTKAAH